MPAITFPMSAEIFADLLRVRSVSWRLANRQELSEAGGEQLAADLGPRLFEADIETAPMEHVEADQLQVKVDALDGALQSFYLWNPRRPYPQSDPDGTVLGEAEIELLSLGVNNKSLALTGLPAGYVVTPGDMLAVDYASPERRMLFRFVEGGAASGAGETPQLEVRPHLRPGMVVGDPAFLARPAGKMVMVPDTAEVVQVSMVHSVLRFTARQTLRAG